MTADVNGKSVELDQKLHTEVLNLIQYITRLRQEIAGIAQQDDTNAPFEGMADRLDAIITSTADATDNILGAMESVDTLVDKLREHPDEAGIDAICDQISQKTMDAMEACSFQDLTGQRVNKVISSMRFVEERVNAMADLCGREEINALSGDAPIEVQQTDDGIVLDGPQRDGDAISQDEIDNLFS